MSTTYKLLRTSDGGSASGSWSAGDPFPHEVSELEAHALVETGRARLAPGQTLPPASERVEVAALAGGDLPAAERAPVEVPPRDRGPS